MYRKQRSYAYPDRCRCGCCVLQKPMPTVVSMVVRSRYQLDFLTKDDSTIAKMIDKVRHVVNRNNREKRLHAARIILLDSVSDALDPDWLSRRDDEVAVLSGADAVHTMRNVVAHISENTSQLVWLKLPSVHDRALTYGHWPCELRADLRLHLLCNLSVLQSRMSKISSAFTLTNTTLQYLDMSENYELGTLSSSITDLTALRCLKLSRCSLSTLPDISRLKSLTRLDLHGCQNLHSLAELANSSLRYLELSNCTGLTTLPNLCAIESLKKLDLTGCSSISEIQGLEHLTSLQQLICSRSRIAALRSSNTLTSLQALDLHDSYDLTTLNVTGLTKLQILNIELSQAHSLFESLETSRGKLSSLVGFDTLTALVNFNSSGCIMLMSSLDFTQLVMLQTVNLSGCKALTSVRGINALRVLGYLNMNRCSKVSGTLDVTGLTALRELHVSACTSLITIQGIDTLVALEILDMSSCSELKGVFDVTAMTALRELNVSACTSLTSLQGIDTLTSLERLCMTDITNKAAVK
jgi:hypothetical protein